jgi:hypothetical protein
VRPFAFVQAGLCAILVGWAGVTYGAELEATVDRNTVRQNQSFSYSLRLTGSESAEPDFAALGDCCEIIGRHRNVRMNWVNGDYERVTEWQLNLMARDSGPLAIPGIKIGHLVSNPVTLMVLAPELSTAGGDIFLEVTAEPQHPYVQAETSYTLRLFLGVDTRGQRLSELSVSGGEAIVERVGEDARFQAERNGRSYTVIERRYSIFPQESGTLTIEPLVFEGQVVSGRTFSDLQRHSSDAIELMVKPVEPPPASHPEAIWLPARRLELQDDWSSESLTAGVPVTRRLTVRADGLLDTQIPALVLAQMEGVRQYSDQPELSKWATEQGIQGRRVETLAVIAGNSGEYQLPAIEVPWFDVANAKWRVARLPRHDFDVIASSEQQAAAAEVSAASGMQPGLASPALTTETMTWRWLSAALTGGWLLTLVAWFFSRRHRRVKATRDATPDGPRPWAAERRVLRDLRRAAEASDATQASQLLLVWAELRFDTGKLKSLGSVFPHVGPVFKNALQDLEHSLYGPEGQAWNGDKLVAALKNVDAVNQRDADNEPADALLPLYR